MEDEEEEEEERRGRCGSLAADAWCPLRRQTEPEPFGSLGQTCWAGCFYSEGTAAGYLVLVGQEVKVHQRNTEVQFLVLMRL